MFLFRTMTPKITEGQCQLRIWFHMIGLPGEFTHDALWELESASDSELLYDDR